MWSDVGRWICRPDLLTGDSVVYTFGSEGISHFEVELSPAHADGDPLLQPHHQEKHERSLVKREEFRFHRRGLGTEDNATLATLKVLPSTATVSNTKICRLGQAQGVPPGQAQGVAALAKLKVCRPG